MGKLGDFRGLAGGVGGVDDGGLPSGLVSIVEAENALCAARLVYLAEVERRGLAKKMGASSAARWWARSVHITDGKAGFEVGLGVWLTEHPSVLAAMTEGGLDRDHAAAVRDGVNVVLAADPEVDAGAVEAELLELASIAKVADVARRAEAIALPATQAKFAREQKKYEEEKAEQLRQEQADRERRERERQQAQDRGGPDPTPVPDPTPDPEPEPVPPVPPVPPAEDASLNTYSLFLLPSGRSEWRGNFDKMTTEKMTSMLQPLTKPQPGPNGERDERSTARRNADALALLLSEGGFGKSIVTTLLTVSLADLTGHNGSGCEQWPFELSWTGPVSRELARLITCDADLVPIVVDGAGVPLAMGDLVRLATEEQRLAVYARDRCCVGCGRPKEFCQVHHTEHWIDGGPSDVTNYALLCPDCHRLVHHRGWEVVMGNDGHPWMIPPVSVDPDRTPIASYHRRHRRSA